VVDWGEVRESAETDLQISFDQVMDMKVLNIG